LKEIFLYEKENEIVKNLKTLYKKNELEEKLSQISTIGTLNKNNNNNNTVNNANNNNNVINQNTINNQQNNLSITVQLRPYDDPKMADDMDDIMEDAWGKMKSISTFIERLHLCPDLPENNNMCITNLRTKLAKVFNGKDWVTKDQDAFLNEIIAQSTIFMDKWVKAKKNRKKYEDDFNEYLDTVGRKQFDEDTKRELILLCYDAYSNGIVNIKSSTKKYLKIVDEVD